MPEIELGAPKHVLAFRAVFPKPLPSIMIFENVVKIFEGVFFFFFIPSSPSPPSSFHCGYDGLEWCTCLAHSSGGLHSFRCSE